MIEMYNYDGHHKCGVYTKEFGDNYLWIKVNNKYASDLTT
jgi:hypothetical protein